MKQESADRLFRQFAEMFAGLGGGTSSWIRVKFKGDVYYFGGTAEEDDGSLCLPGQYERFEPSYAYLIGDRVMRFEECIGKRGDLEFLPSEDDELAEKQQVSP